MGLLPPDFDCKVEGGVGGLQSIVVELAAFPMCLNMHTESSFSHKLLQFSFVELFLLLLKFLGISE